MIFRYTSGIRWSILWFGFVLLLAFGFWQEGRAQVNDAGLWLEFSIKKKITKKFDAVLTEELRFNENMTELGSFYTDIGVEYEVLKGFKAGAFYRFICKRRLDDSYSRINRYYFDLSYGNNIKRFKFSYRFRFQSQYRDYNTRPEGHVAVNYIRQKLELGINTKTRFDPYLGAEVWYLLNSPWRRFDNLRLSAGVVTRITKHHFIDTGYIYQHEFNVNKPLTDYIVFLGYKFLF